MRVDQIEILAVADLPAQEWQDGGSKGERCPAHSDLGQQQITRMVDMQRVAGLLARDSGKDRIAAEPRGPEWKPRTGRHDPSADGGAFNQFSEARLDKNPVLGLRRARI